MIGAAPGAADSRDERPGTFWRRAWAKYRRRQMRARIPYEGLAYMVILIMLMAGSLFGKSNMLLLVFAFMAGPWIINGALCYTLLRGVDMRRRSPSHVMAGEPFSVEITLTNAKRFLSSWVLTVTDRLQHAYEQITPRVMFTRVPARSERTAHYQARLMYRGRYQLGPVRVATQFPLGLAERSLVIHESDEILVYPQLGELSPRWRQQSQHARELVQQSTVRQGSFDDEFHRLREYRSGDDPRSIHWRTSARQNELMVREFHQSREDDLTLLLDLWLPARPTVEDYRRIEYAISFTATIGYEHCLDARGSQLGISILGREVTEWQGVAGPYATHPFLERLALAEAGPAEELAPFVQKALSQHREMGRCLLITTRPTEYTATEPATMAQRLAHRNGDELRAAHESLTRLLREEPSRRRLNLEIIEAAPEKLDRLFHLEAPRV